MFGLGKTLTFVIKVFFGCLKSILGVVLLCFDFDWQIYGEKVETAHFWKIRCSTPRRRSAHLGVALYLGEPKV